MRYTLVMTRVKIEYMLFAAMSLVAGAAYGRGPVVAAVGSGPWAKPDLYVGEWYEIARFDHPVQEGTVGSRVVYRLLSESKMRIVYRGKDGRTGRDRISSAKGRLSADYECLRVSSCWFFYSDYTMSACDSAAERQWVVVSGRSAKYLWILARRPRLSTQVLVRILDQVEKQGFDTDKLHFVDQR